MCNESANPLQLNINTALERMGKPVRSNFLSKNGGKHMEETNVTVTAEEMQEIQKLNKDKRYYTSTPELLKSYAEMVPSVDEQV